MKTVEMFQGSVSVIVGAQADAVAQIKQCDGMSDCSANTHMVLIEVPSKKLQRREVLFNNDDEIDASKVDFSKKENVEHALKMFRDMGIL